MCDDMCIIYYPSLESSLYQEKISDSDSLLVDLKSIADPLSKNTCCYYQPYLWVFGGKYRKYYRYSVFEQEIERITYEELPPCIRKRVDKNVCSESPTGIGDG